MRPAKLNARRLKLLLTIQPQTKQYLQHIGKSFAQTAPTFIMHAQSQTIRHLHTTIMHLIYPPKFCITFVFHFSWALQPSQEKLKIMLMQNFGREIQCIMGDVEVAHSNFLGLITTPLVGLI